MILSSTLRLRGAALLAALALAPFANARHEAALPDTTYAAAQIRDIPALRALQDTHPLALDAKKAGFEQFIAPGIKRFNEELAKDKNSKTEGFKKFLEALKGNLFTGEVLVALVQTPKPDKGHDPYDVIYISDTGSDEKTIGEIFAGSEIQRKEGGPFKLSVTDFQGVALHESIFTNGDEAPVSLGGWALVDKKTFVYASAPNVLRDAVDALKNNGRKDSFGNTTLWKRSYDAAGKPDLFFIANLPLATAELRKIIVNQAKDEGNALAVDTVKAYDALALEPLEGLWYSLEATPTEIIGKSSLSFKERRGLLTLDTFKPLENPVPSFIPDDKNLIWGVIRYDLTQAWKNFELLLAQALPTLKPMLDGQLTHIKAKEGIDLRDAFLENFGENIVFVNDISGIKELTGKENLTPNDLATKSNQGLLIADVRDSAKLASLIDTAVGKIGQGGAEAIFAERDFMGVKIRTIKETQKNESPTIAYALHAKKFFFSVGAEKVLEKVIAEIESPQGTLAKNPIVQQALKRLPKGASSFGVYDMGSYTDYAIDVLAVQFRFLGKQTQKDLDSVVDFSKRPAPDSLPWIGTAYSESRPNELYYEGVFFRKEEAK